MLRPMVRDVMLALGVGAVLGGGAWLGATGDADVLPDPGRAELVQRARGAVLEAQVSGCSGGRQGSVTILDMGRGPEGLTNAHVVEGATEVSLSGGPDAEGPGRATVDSVVVGRDAARLRVDGVASASALTPGARPAVGERVLVAGFPGGEFRATAATVARIEDRTGAGGTSPVMLIDTQARPGASGGVVMDRHGRAVGLVVARDPDTGWVVAYPLGEVSGAARPATAGC